MAFFAENRCFVPCGGPENTAVRQLQERRTYPQDLPFPHNAKSLGSPKSFAEFTSGLTRRRLDIPPGEGRLVASEAKMV
jgi:hypothetical protein